MSLEPLLARFYEIMLEGKTIYEELVRLSRQKKLAIVDKAVDSLDSVVRLEQGAVMRLGQWERVRTECVGKLAAKLGGNPSGATFLFFAQSAPPENRPAFLLLHQELSALLKELSELNEANRELLEARLEYVRFALDTLSESLDPGGYDARGSERSVEGDTGRTIFNREV